MTKLEAAMMGNHFSEFRPEESIAWNFVNLHNGNNGIFVMDLFSEWNIVVLEQHIKELVDSITSVD